VQKSLKKKRVLIYDEEGLSLLAKRLKEIRAEKGFTQEDLAYESDIALSQIARIETCRINPTVSTIFKIARTLDIPVSELFNFKFPPKQTINRPSKL
jgi:transcriptional regulator with XRE-family HTH domain